MEDFNLLAPLLLAIVGLLVGAILKSILKRTGFPYTVGLFVFGLLIGLFNRFHYFDFMPRVENAVATVADTNPDFILYVFLPILIFDAAYEMNMHIFKKTLANSTLLAVPGLVVCMLLTAALMIGISLFAPEYTSWTWPLALMFGALISATDPVAVVALLHELGTSKRFSTLVDGESLLNDGTSIVCFMLFFGAYTLSGASTASPVVQFLEVVIGGILLGFCLARLTIWFITRINSEEMIQNSVIILSAYVTFILSQYYMGISGVIALVAFGLTISYTGRPRLKPQVNVFMEKFWGLLTHIANTLVFIMVGVVIAEKVEPELVRPHHFAACLRRTEPHPVCHDHAFLPRYEKIGIRTFQTRVRHSDMGWPARSIRYDTGPDGFLHTGNSGRHQTTGLVSHSRYRHAHSFHQCHHHALATETIGLNTSFQCQSTDRLQNPRILTRQCRKVYGKTVCKGGIARRKLEQSEKIPSTVSVFVSVRTSSHNGIPFRNTSPYIGPRKGRMPSTL